MLSKENFAGKAEGVINRKKVGIEIALTVSDGRIKELTITASPSTTRTKIFSVDLTKRLLHKRIQEASQFTPAHIATILRMTREEAPLADTFAHALGAAVHDYTNTRSHHALQEVVDHVSGYNQGFPERTFGDYQFEHGDSECCGKH